MTAVTILDRLDRVRKTGPASWVARCPCHESKSKSSLAIRETSDGRVLMHDFGGCATADVLGAIGVEVGELFPADGDRDARGRSPDYRTARGRGARQTRANIDARTALVAIAADALEVAVLAGDVADGRAVGDARLQLWALAGRITSALELSGARNG